MVAPTHSIGQECDFLTRWGRIPYAPTRGQPPAGRRGRRPLQPPAQCMWVKKLPLRGKNAPFSIARCGHWSPTGNARHTVGAHSICARKGAAACGASGTPPPTAVRAVYASPPHRRGAFHMRPQGGSRLRGVGDAAPYSYPHSVCRSKQTAQDFFQKFQKRYFSRS